MKHIIPLIVLILFYIGAFIFFWVINLISWGCWTLNTVATASAYTTIIALLFNIWQLSKKE